jgi:hypothetical protein
MQVFSKSVQALALCACVLMPSMVLAQDHAQAQSQGAEPAKQAAPKFTREAMAQWKKEVLSQYKEVHFFDRANKEVSEEAFTLLMLEQNQSITMKRVGVTDGVGLNVKVLTEAEIAAERAKAAAGAPASPH